jgi:hypothetical protein
LQVQNLTVIIAFWAISRILVNANAVRQAHLVVTAMSTVETFTHAVTIS